MAIREILVIVPITSREKDSKNIDRIGFRDNAIAATKPETFLRF